MFSNKSEKLESFIGTNSAFKGDISTKGTLRVDGKVTGNIDADWVVLGERAYVKGDINAGGVVTGGTIEGSIKAKELVEIKNKGVIRGDLFTSKLIVIEGGVIDGKVAMQREATNLIELSRDKIKEAGN